MKINQLIVISILFVSACFVYGLFFTDSLNNEEENEIAQQKYNHVKKQYESSDLPIQRDLTFNTSKSDKDSSIIKQNVSKLENEKVVSETDYMKVAYEHNLHIKYDMEESVENPELTTSDNYWVGSKMEESVKNPELTTSVNYWVGSKMEESVKNPELTTSVNYWVGSKMEESVKNPELYASANHWVASEM
jgi:hypothetical protein